MNVRKFFAKTSREALKMVRNELGDNAIILSNKEIDGGSQILASREEDMDTLIHNAPSPAAAVKLSGKQPAAVPSKQKQRDERPDSFLSHVRNQRREEHPSYASQYADDDFLSLNKEEEAVFNRIPMQQPAFNQPQQNQAGFNARHAEALQEDDFFEPNYQQTPASKMRDSFGQDTASKASIHQQANTQAPTYRQDETQEMASVMSEIRTMRNMLQSQIAEIAWANTQRREPFKANLLNRMLTAGFSPSLSRQITEKLPKFNTFDQAEKWTDAILCNNLKTIENEDTMLDKGGVFAVIGPTGVGKTTTTAKLAARFVMKHGANKLGLITTDSYRIAGHEQLRIYGKILGVMVHSVKDQADLEIALNELRHKHTILIDTVGVSQRDQMVTEQIALLSSPHFHIKKLLCLNSTNTNETLTDVIRAYRGRGIDGCILTKLDEAATIGSALDVIIREKLQLYFVANGQRVPEDLIAPNKQYLVHRAFKLGAVNSQLFQHRPEDLAIMMANSISMEQQGKSNATGAMEFNHV